MRRLRDFLSEDTNQFGPGTDLMIALLGLLLVMFVVTSHLYGKERKTNEETSKLSSIDKEKLETLQRLYDAEKRKNQDGGHFRVASVFFSAGYFESYPVTKLRNATETDSAVQTIIQEYRAHEAEFPYLIVVGHSNQLDDRSADDTSYKSRLERNWLYAGRRAALIAGLMQQYLGDAQKEKLVVVSTGELDMKFPDQPYSPDNAWVEVVFGNQWKLPAAAAK